MLLLGRLAGAVNFATAIAAADVVAHVVFCTLVVLLVTVWFADEPFERNALGAVVRTAVLGGILWFYAATVSQSFASVESDRFWTASLGIGVVGCAAAVLVESTLPEKLHLTAEEISQSVTKIAGLSAFVLLVIVLVVIWVNAPHPVLYPPRDDGFLAITDSLGLAVMAAIITVLGFRSLRGRTGSWSIGGVDCAGMVEVIFALVVLGSAAVRLSSWVGH